MKRKAETTPEASSVGSEGKDERQVEYERIKAVLPTLTRAPARAPGDAPTGAVFTSPVYGDFSDKFVPVLTVNPEHQHFGDAYEIDGFCTVRNKQTKHCLKPNSHGQVGLKYFGFTKNYVVHRLGVASHFGRDKFDITDATVDHLNGDWKDSWLGNLGVVTREENTRRAKFGKPESAKARRSRSKAVVATKDNKSQSFESMNEAAHALKIHQGTISSALKMNHRAGGYTFSLIIDNEQVTLPGEIWTKPNDNLPSLRAELIKHGHIGTVAAGKVCISNLGRVQTSQGIRKWPLKEARGSTYRMYAHCYVHILVMLAFCSEAEIHAAEGKIILHRDDLPLDADGCCSNKFTDLKFGTQSENIHSYHKHKKLKFLQN